MSGSGSATRMRLVLALAALIVLALVVLGVVRAGDVSARRTVFGGDWPRSGAGVAQPADLSPGPPVMLIETGAPDSAAFAELLAPLMPPGAVLRRDAHTSTADGLQLDEAWYQLPDGAVLLVTRNYVGPEYSVPVDAVFNGRQGGVEYWDNGIEAAVSSTPYFAEIKAALDGWIITLAAQEGPVWFGEGEPPPGFFQEGRGVVPDLSELRTLVQEIINTPGVLHTP